MSRNEEDNMDTLDFEDVRKIIAPGIEERKRIKAAINDHAYYIIIVVLSLIAAFVPPLVAGSLQGDMTLNFPKTPEAWAIWGGMNGSVAIMNVAILVMFKLQAKRNVKDNEAYRQACAKLNKLAGRREVFVPRSPREMNRKDYAKKGTTVLVGTIGSFAMIGPLLISFDVVTLISTVISVAISLAASWSAMIRNEEYWTEEFPLYADMVTQRMAKKEAMEKKEEDPHDHDREERTPEPAGAGLEEHAEHPAP